MQCFMKKKDKSLIDEENVETTYFDNCFLRRIGLRFAFVSSISVLLLSHSVQLTFGVFIVLSCWHYQSQHRYDFCAQIEIFIVISPMLFLFRPGALPMTC